jgi:HAE1 family hydrophobic/amphiphilic exporter-1
MSRLTRLSLANRSVVLLLALLTVLAGALSATSLKQELIPNIATPMGTIISIYPGASPETVESDVTKKIEDAIKGVEGVTDINSTSASNTSTINVEWDYGEDDKQITSDIRSAIDGISSDLPETVDPEVITGSFDDVPVLLTAVSSDSSPTVLSDDVENVIVPAIKKVSGVRDVSVAGDEEHEIDITFDQAKLNNLHIDPANLRQILGANQSAIPSGTMKTATSNIDVQTGTTYKSAEEIGEIELQGEDGRPVRLKRVATIEERPVDDSSISRVNGVDAVTLAITKDSSANTVAVTKAVHAELDKLQQKAGHGTKFTTVFDQAPWIEQSIHDLTTEGGIGLVMAVLVILLFLRSLGPTLITGISIPISLFFALIALKVGGYSLNIFTLGALTVAIGRVVDDSIVVIENIKRHQGLGESGFSTLVGSVKEVAGAVTSSTLTTVAVFLPIGLVSGQAGELFRPFALTVTVALLASLFVSLTVVPVLASYFMQRHGADVVHAHDESHGWLQNTYIPVLNWALGHRAITLILAVGLFVGTMALTPLLKTDFIGAGSAENLQVVQKLPTGTSLAETDAAARKVEQVIDADPNFGTYSTSIAEGSSLFVATKNDTNEATIMVLLKPGTDATKAAKRLRASLAKLHDVGDIEVAIGDSETSSKIVMYVESPNQDNLIDANDKTLAMLKRVKGLTNIESDLAEKREMLQVGMRSREAADLGMTKASVGEAVSWAVRGEKIGEMSKGNRTLDIYLRSQEPAKSLEEIDQVVLPVTQKMTMDARKDAGDRVEDWADDFEDANKHDATKAYKDSKKELKKQQQQADEQAVQLRAQLQDARHQLAKLQAQLKKAQQGSDPNKIGENVYRISEAISAMAERISELSAAVSSSGDQADSMGDQLDQLRDQREDSLDNQDTSDAISNAGERAQKVDATPVRLNRVANVQMVEAASQITRVDGARAVTITAASEGNDLSATTAAIKTGIAKLDLPDGVTIRVGGVSQDQQESFAQLGNAMLAAIAIVFLIMAATFGSLIQPLILLISIPFAATGALGLSLATDTPLGVPSMIGLLMLIGIVVTNAIVLIDLINQKRSAGADVEESIMAGARLRVRPIVMTALATISALIPMGLGLTGGGVFISKPLAIVVIGGLISSSILTLILVPVLYDLVERRPRWLRPHLASRESLDAWSEGPGPEQPHS